jgi:hypothetical protein
LVVWERTGTCVAVVRRVAEERVGSMEEVPEVLETMRRAGDG